MQATTPGQGPTLHVHAAGKTDKGRVRERNEDSFLIDERRQLYVVADGMGGHAGGQRASSLAVEVLGKHVQGKVEQLDLTRGPSATDSASSTPPGASLLIDGVRAACQTIFDTAAREPALMGMGTTTTALLVRESWGYVAHVGDSRCYVRRGGQMLQVTEDHSLVNEQVKAGLLTPEMARHSRHKNIITRSVGFERDVAVDTYLLPIQPGDRFLLCSDGLSNLIERAEMSEAMGSLTGPALVDFLVDLALKRGGDDNITVVSVDLEASQAQHAAAGAPLEAVKPLAVIEGDTPPLPGEPEASP